MALPIEKTSTGGILLRDGSGYIVLEQGTTVPADATAGYAKGATFFDTDVVTGIDGVYRNIGTSTSSIFVSANVPTYALAGGTVSAQAATATLVAADLSGKVTTNTGASGATTLTLPAASTLTGKYFSVTVLAAQIVNLSPIATDGVFLNGSGVDNKDLILAGTIGTSATVYSNGSDYYVVSHTSGVTKEA